MNRLSGIEALLLRTAATWLSPAGARASLLTLTYHRVLPERDQILADEPTGVEFAAQLDLIADIFNVMTVSEAVARLRTGSLPSRALCITFDDGYANNCTVAARLLAERGLRATFFVAAGFLDGGMMWNDQVIEAVRRAPRTLDLSSLGLGSYRLDDSVHRRRRAVDELLGRLKYLDPEERSAKAKLIVDCVGAGMPDGMMMTRAQVRELASLGMEVGAHSVNHPILTAIDAAEARREIFESKARLEEILGVEVTSFAYPNGKPGVDYDLNHVAMVRDAGYSAAVSTEWGRATASTDVLQLPRIAPWDKTARAYGARMVLTYLQRPATGCRA